MNVEQITSLHVQDDGGLVAGEEEDAPGGGQGAAAAAGQDNGSANATVAAATTERAQLEFTHHLYEEYLPSLPRESKPPIIIQTVPHYQVGKRRININDLGFKLVTQVVT